MAIWGTSDIAVEKITAKFDSIPPSIVDTEPQNFVILRYLYHCLPSPPGPPVGTCPVPLSGDDSMPANQSLSITFSEPLNPSTIPALSDSSTDPVFLQGLVYASTCEIGSIIPSSLTLSADEQNLIVNPTDVLTSGTYELVFMPQSSPPLGNRITDHAGNVLDYWPWRIRGGCYKLNFRVSAASDTSPPSVSWTLPDNGASNVSEDRGQNFTLNLRGKGTGFSSKFTEECLCPSCLKPRFVLFVCFVEKSSRLRSRQRSRFDGIESAQSDFGELSSAGSEPEPIEGPSTNSGHELAECSRAA